MAGWLLNLGLEPPAPTPGPGTVFSGDDLTGSLPLEVNEILLSDPRSVFDFKPTLLVRDVFVSSSEVPFLVVIDSDGDVVFDTGASTVLFDVTQNDRRTMQWKNATYSQDRYLTVVFSAQSVSDSAGQSVSNVNARLPPRALAVGPPHVFSLDGLENDISIEAGYNIRLDDEADIDGSVSSISLSAIAGEGLGLEPADCGDENDVLVRTVNGVGPDEYGNFQLQTSDCYWVEPLETTSPEERGLKLRNDCLACVNCEDFDVVYERLRKVYVRASNLTTQLQDARTKLIEQIDAIAALKDELDDPSGTSSIARTGDRQHDIGFRIWTGTRTFDQATVTATVTTPDIDIELAKYTTRIKLPNRAVVLGEPSPGVSGTTFTHVESFSFEEYEFAFWQSTFIFDSSVIDGDTTANIDWTITLQAADGLGDETYTGSHSIDLTLPTNS